MGKSSKTQRYESRIDELFEMAQKVGFTEMVEHLCMNYMFNRNWSVNMIGISGVGKNAIVAKATSVMKNIYPEFNFILFSGLSMLPEDVGGMPGYGRTLADKPFSNYQGENGLAKLLYDFTTTPLTYDYYLFRHIEAAFEPGWKGMIFVDEIAACEEDTKRRIYQFFYDRELNGKRLSDGCMVVFAMNPPSLEEYNLQPMPKPFIDRMSHFVVESTVSDWLKFVREDEIDYSRLLSTISGAKAAILDRCDSMSRKHHKLVIEFVAQNISVFNEYRGRRLSHLSDCLIAFEKFNNVTVKKVVRATAAKMEHQYRMLTQEVQAALVPSVAAEFLSFVAIPEPVTAVSYLRGENTIADIKELINSEDMTAIITKLNDDICHVIGEQGRGVFPEAETNGCLEDESKVAIINDRLFEYLDFLQKEAQDTSVAFMNAFSAKVPGWQQLSDIQNSTRVTNPDHKRIIRKAYDLKGIPSSIPKPMNEGIENPEKKVKGKKQKKQEEAEAAQA